MKAPTSLFDRPGRAAAVVGAVVAVSASAAVALVSGTAAAQEPGRCTENVNVRSEPDVSSQIVALCEAGSEVQTGESRDGFVQLTNLGGWAAQEYISVNGQNPAPAERATGSESDESAESGEDADSGERSGDAAGTSEEDGAAGETGQEAGEETEAGAAEDGTAEEDSQPSGQQSGGGGGGLGGLLG
jgi:hypothetical protein